MLQARTIRWFSAVVYFAVAYGILFLYADSYFCSAAKGQSRPIVTAKLALAAIWNAIAGASGAFSIWQAVAVVTDPGQRCDLGNRFCLDAILDLSGLRPFSVREHVGRRKLFLHRRLRHDVPDICRSVTHGGDSHPNMGGLKDTTDKRPTLQLGHGEI